MFRISPLSLLAVAALTICATPVAFGAPGLELVYLVPLGLIVWILRTRTTADAETVAARGVLRSRRVPWPDITALRLRTRSRVSAVLTDGTELPLPAVHLRDLPTLAAVSGGRLPDPTADPAPEPDPETAADPAAPPSSS